MLLTLVVLTLLQDSDVESHITRLENGDAAVREKAAEDLIRRGPNIVPRILALYRTSASTDLQSRALDILRRFPFRAFVETTADEALRQQFKQALVSELETHRPSANCWLEKEKQPTLDISKVRMRRQTGNGHGQTLELEEYVSGEKGVLVIRRIAFQGSPPWAVKMEESVRVQESRLDAEATKSFHALLVPLTALRSHCAILDESDPSDPFALRWALLNQFTMCLDIESGGKKAVSMAYTGFPCSEGLPDYAHGKIIDRLMKSVEAEQTWSDVTLDEVGRASLLSWIKNDFMSQDGWVKEHYLAIVRFLGDESFLPFLRTVAKELEGKEQGERQRKAALDAIERIIAKAKAK